MSLNLRVQSSEFIDETVRISFKFNGKTYYGFKGDTLASALLANNVHLIGRSFKYHRPRGIMTAGSEEPNAIVQINNNTNVTELSYIRIVIYLNDSIWFLRPSSHYASWSVIFKTSTNQMNVIC